MGSPGCGKTSVGRLLAAHLNMPCVDVDDDYLEHYWGVTVAHKLKEVGDHQFLEEEGRALLDLEVEGSILSLTGSNPLHVKAMSRVVRSGVVVYLDVSKYAIIARLSLMKVDRIVGQKLGANMADILDYRQEFYQRWYDVRVIVEDRETLDNIALKVAEAVNNFTNDGGFVSSRGGADGTGDVAQHYVSFLDVVLKGLAPDGGLYLRAGHRPHFTLGELRRLMELDFRERSLRILERWIHPLDLSPQEIRDFLYRSFKHKLFACPEVAPVRRLVDNHFMLELFHGPTASFKDLSMQLMPRFFVKAMQTCSDVSKYLILVATSGDTGGAVLDGFIRHAADARVGVMVLYPQRGISKIQHHQMTTMAGPNVKVVGVDASFDYCQNIIKQVFNDEYLADWMKKELGCRLSAANSINWGRLLPQVLYHSSAYLEMARTGQITFGQPVDLCVPTGNFGNILSAYYTKEMGFPVRRLICASNANNVLTEFIKNGVYVLRGRAVQRTASPSIDILQSSNLERLIFHLSGEDPTIVNHFYATLKQEGVAAAPAKVWEIIQQHFLAGYATESDCKAAIINTFKATGYMMDPHTAVGRSVAVAVGDHSVPTVIYGTAHFAKFVDKILPFLYGAIQDYQTLSVQELMERAGELTRQPAMHPHILAMVDKQIVHQDIVAPDYDHITRAITQFAQQL